MKKNPSSLRTILCGIFVALFVFYGCKPEQKESYLTALPADAVLVVSLNSTNLIEKAEAKSLIEEGLNKFYTENQEMQTLLKTILNDPAQSGFDPNQNQLFYVQATRNFGVLLPVIDTEKVKSLFQAIEKEGGCQLSEKDGLNLISFKEEKIVGWFNSSALMLQYSEDLTTEGNQTAVMGYLKQDKAQSLLSDRTFDEFLKINSDLDIWVDMSKAFSLSQMQGVPSYQEMYKGIFDVQDMRIAYYTQFNKGEIAISCKSLFITDEAKLKAEASIGRLMAKMNGSLLKYLPKNDWMCVGTNIQSGEIFYQMFTNVEPFKTQMQESGNLIDYKSLFSSLKGDVVVATAPSVPATPLPQFNILMETTDNSIISAISIAGKGSQMPIEMVAADNYKVSIPFVGISIQWGYCNGVTYITNNPDLYGQLNGKTPLPKESLATAPQADLFKNSYSSVWLDFTTILQIYGQYLTQNNPMGQAVMPVLSQFVSFEQTAKDMFSVEMKIKMTNPEENSLKQFVSVISGLSNR